MHVHGMSVTGYLNVVNVYLCLPFDLESYGVKFMREHGNISLSNYERIQSIRPPSFHPTQRAILDLISIAFHPLFETNFHVSVAIITSRFR